MKHEVTKIKGNLNLTANYDVDLGESQNGVNVNGSVRFLTNTSFKYVDGQTILSTALIKEMQPGRDETEVHIMLQTSIGFGTHRAALDIQQAKELVKMLQEKIRIAESFKTGEKVMLES